MYWNPGTRQRGSVSHIINFPFLLNALSLRYCCLLLPETAKDSHRPQLLLDAIASTNTQQPDNDVHEEAVAGPLAPLGAPCWKPFLNLRATNLRYLIRPVPVVFLRLAFSLQLSGVRLDMVRVLHTNCRYEQNSHFLVLAAGYPQLLQVFFCM